MVSSSILYGMQKRDTGPLKREKWQSCELAFNFATTKKVLGLSLEQTDRH